MGYGILDMKPLPSLPNCSEVKPTPHFSLLTPVYLTISRGVSTLFQAIYLGITLFKFIRLVPTNARNSVWPLYRLFIRDGIGYFVIIFGVNISAFLSQKMGGQLFEVYGAVWIVSLPSVAGCRMVLNIRDAINEQLPIIERSEARQSFISSDVRHITRQRTRDVESSVDQTGFSHTSTEIVYGIAI
ncbi:hypothetical protein M422DRAFT_270606 [Sphaerobolus stellatus SS14]|uniref:Uncharacterized protein n=1 Tax=Sphaerobolus stellatus (strain SS14) TaxID=990650 RepID=A0A0C9TFH5_SPHS4|nr:hypothetical protein M422DRAFT_270606 [Sphaerobolus stellatus SS14]